MYKTYEEAKKYFEETFNQQSAKKRLAQWLEDNPQKNKKEEKKVEDKADEE
jgi:hypothetical protein|tara:strand:- start:128 stop:280 length:153 start_codon:yes stop_codon:yes gene_type:complete